MTRAAVIAAAIALAAPAPAPARPSAATVRLGDAVALARAYWHDEPCQPTAWMPVDPKKYDGISIGRPDLDICAWGVAPAWRLWTWGRLCRVVVHEFGHLAGRPHVKDRRSIMFGGDLDDHPEICGTAPRSTPIQTAAR